ncbi:MAG: hypothetical protein EPGJADBJ_04321 [Saprospiraceae bacterium]|nr:hypothetical protein [Saprospiraceae bacterium]
MMKYLMLSCREATRLTEKKLTSGRLSLLDNIQLAMHLRMCERCRRYAQQSTAIEKVLERQLKEQEENEVNYEGEPPVLPNDFRERLLRRLQQGDGI